MTFEEMKNEIFSFVYLTTTTCNVCKILQPKLRELAENYKEATFHEILMDEQPEAKGFFMAFAVPTFIVYSGGQEILRTARHISVDESRNTLDRYYGMIF
jgi:thiol-disulfide isomerase/thioredoxin